MKTVASAFLLVFFSSVQYLGAVAPGDNRQAVVEELGEAPSYVRTGNQLIWIYDRGRIEFAGDIVTTVDLLTPEQMQARREREAQRAAAIRMERDAELRRMTEEMRLRTERLREARLARNAEDEYLQVLSDLQSEEEKIRKEEEREFSLTQLEARVLEAQAGALRAEESAARARERAASAVETAQEVREQQAIAQRDRQSCDGIHLLGNTCNSCGFGTFENAYPVYYGHGPIRRRNFTGPAPIDEKATRRYNTEKRLGPSGPTFGGAPPRWSR
jgi:cytochrome c5